MLFKEIVDARTDARADGRTTDIEGSQKLTEHFVLRWAKNNNMYIDILQSYMSMQEQVKGSKD